ncbi:MAG: hypothetical protein HKM95_12790, partial [Inquilinus sp.]|nr:hypothetical protein [Inquilinus sp.]
MGYHVTILRTEGRKRRPISGEELAAAAGTIPELRYDAAGPSVVDIREGETRARLILSDGELWTKNPDEGTLAVMIRLAEA